MIRRYRLPVGPGLPFQLTEDVLHGLDLLPGGLVLVVEGQARLHADVDVVLAQLPLLREALAKVGGLLGLCCHDVGACET